MNFSAIDENAILGRILRFPLRLIPAETVMPVFQGILRGKRWIVGSSNHGCWLGSYEYVKSRAFADVIKPGMVVYDIGAHVGYYTLIASALVGGTGKVIAFEPSPRNLYYLKKHLDLNHATNVRVIEAAVTDQNGDALFMETPSGYTGHLAPIGGVEVHTVELDDLTSSNTAPPPDLVKLDVEGAEFLALLGAVELLEKHHPVIFLATHGLDVHQRCYDLLLSFGYRLTGISGEEAHKTDELLALY